MDFDQESIDMNTKRQVERIAKAIIHPRDAQLNGTHYPSVSNLQMLSAQGSRAIVMGSETASALIAYPLELTARSGQPTIHVYERNAAGNVVRVTSIPTFQRLSTNYSTTGTLSSMLSVRNASSSDNRSGTLSAAVLRDLPTELRMSEMTQTDLSYSSYNDITTCSAEGDGVVAISTTEHFGKKQYILEDSLSIRRGITGSNRRTLSINLPSTTPYNTDNNKGFLSFGDINESILNRPGNGDFNANPQKWDTVAAYLHSTNNIGFKTYISGGSETYELPENIYGVRASGTVSYTIQNPNNVALPMRDLVVSLVCLDDSNDISAPMGTRPLVHGNRTDMLGSDSGTSTFLLSFEGYFNSAGAIMKSVRNTRLKMNVKLDDATVFEVTGANLILDFHINDADIPNAPTPIVIVDGVSENDVIHVDGAGALVNAPSSRSASMSNGVAGHEDDSQVYNVALVESLMSNVALSIKSNYKMSEYETYTTIMTEGIRQGDAFSFKKFKKLAKFAKKHVKDLKSIARVADSMGVPGASAALRGIEVADTVSDEIFFPKPRSGDAMSYKSL